MDEKEVKDILAAVVGAVVAGFITSFLKKHL